MGNNTKEPDALRADAEERDSLASQHLSDKELLHELRVHQIELEMQNDELQNMQNRIEESRDNYVDLYDFAPVGYLTLSHDALIINANLTAAEMLGVDRNKLLHRRFVPFVLAECRNAWERRFVSVLQNDEKERIELKLKRADGTDFFAQLDCLHRQVDNTSSVRLSIVDITERKLAEQKLSVSNIQLTQEVARRTAELSALTEHIQEVAETERENLARELHDDLGSILCGLSMEVGKLEGEIDSLEFNPNFTLIRELISAASCIKQNIINQLYPTVLDDCGFSTAIGWLVRDFRQHSGIAVELAVPEEDVVMESSFALAAYRITQECLTNIAKHAGASQVHIDVTTSDGFLDITINDNGKGMPDKISPNRHGIFGMTERARCLGGLMEIGSGERGGTTAHLRLPLAAVKHEARQRVLVVDDHAIVRDAIRQLLDTQTDDFSVEGEASDGVSAVNMALEGQWDIMLLDVSLPKKNGIRVLEAIRKVKPGLPVVMLSSHAQAEYGAMALAKGASGYVEKSETSKLIETMRRATLSLI